MEGRKGGVSVAGNGPASSQGFRGEKSSEFAFRIQLRSFLCIPVFSLVKTKQKTLPHSIIKSDFSCL